MTWNYRIVDLGEKGFGLFEVYYDAEGQPDDWTLEPVSFVSLSDDGPEDLITSLEQALHDVKTYPLLKLIDGKLVEAEP